MADNAAKIAEIKSILEAGASGVSTDGTSVQYDLDELRRQLRELMAEDDAQAGKRPIAAKINLSGF